MAELAHVGDGVALLQSLDPCNPKRTTRVQNTVSTQNTNLELIPGIAGAEIFLCYFEELSAGTTDFRLLYGTTVTDPCDTVPVNIEPPNSWTAQTGKITRFPIRIPAGNNICGVVNQNIAVDILLEWGRHPQ